MIRKIASLALTAGALLILAGTTGCRGPKLPAVNPRMAYIDASSTLRQAADDPDPTTRAHAIEAISQTMGKAAGGILKQALRDAYPSVRFAAAMAVGELRYEPAKEVLVAMARSKGEDPSAEPDRRVYCAVIYALHSLGDTSHTSELGSLLFDDEKAVRANAAMVMGKMGERSGIVPLSTQLAEEQDPSVQLQLVESLAMLGDPKNAIRLEAYTKTQYLEDRLVAIAALERIQSSRSAQVLEDLLGSRQPPRVRVAAAGALARLGRTDPRGYKFVLRSARQPERVMAETFGERGTSEIEVRSLQRLAAIALGWMDKPEAVSVLHPLLQSQDGGVRVAAAMSILRLLASYRPVEELAPVEPEAPAASQPAEGEKPQPQLYTAGAKD